MCVCVYLAVKFAAEVALIMVVWMHLVWWDPFDIPVSQVIHEHHAKGSKCFGGEIVLVYLDQLLRDYVSYLEGGD